jgi:hypothetical protein
MTTNTKNFTYEESPFLLTLTEQIVPPNDICVLELKELNMILTCVLTQKERVLLKDYLKRRIELLKDMGSYKHSVYIDLVLQCSIEIVEFSEALKQEARKNFDRKTQVVTCISKGSKPIHF